MVCNTDIPSIRCPYRSAIFIQIRFFFRVSRNIKSIFSTNIQKQSSI